MRFQVRPVANADCDSLSGNVIGEFETLEACNEWLASSPSNDGWNVAETYNLPFGYGIVDTVTGEIDFGRGFGVAIEAPEGR